MQQPASGGVLSGVIPLNHPYRPYPRGIELERGRERGEEREGEGENKYIYLLYICISLVFLQFLFRIFSESFHPYHPKRNLTKMTAKPTWTYTPQTPFGCNAAVLDETCEAIATECEVSE
jgi:hypothetical protein